MGNARRRRNFPSAGGFGYGGNAGSGAQECEGIGDGGISRTTADRPDGLQRQVLDALDVAILVVDRDGRVTFHNRAAADALTGDAGADLHGHGLADTDAIAWTPGSRQALRECLGGYPADASPPDGPDDGRAIDLSCALEAPCGSTLLRTIGFRLLGFGSDGAVVLRAGEVGEQVVDGVAEDAGRLAPEMLAALLDAMPIMVTWYDAQGRMRLVNQCFERLTGWPREEARGIDLMREVYPDPAYRRHVWEFMMAPGSGWRDFRLRTRDGGELWSSWTNIRLSDGSQVGLGIDVRERRAAERRVAEALDAARAEMGRQYEELTALYREAPVGLALFDAALRYVRVNRRLAEIDGIPIEAHLGRTPAEVLPDLGDALVPALRRVLGTGEPAYGLEITGETPPRPGERRNWLVQIYPLRHGDGRTFAIGAVVEDVTEEHRAAEALRASEERYRTIGETIPYGVWMTDADGRLVHVSRSFVDLIGATFEEVREHGWTRKLAPEAAEAMDEAWRTTVATGEPWEYEYRIRAGDGRLVTVLCLGRPVRDGQGRTVSWVGLNLDITERKESERQLELMAAELNHRVKNTLAMLQSVLTQTARGAHTLEHFLPAFRGRLRALSHAHELISRGDWQGAPLREVVDGELGPYADAEVITEGPEVSLTPKAALSVGLVLHELATNAARHGSLGMPGGRLELTWRPTRDGGLEIDWRERDGPTVRPPTRRGFGFMVLERGLEHDLNARAEVDWDPTGLGCRITLPPSAVLAVETPAP